MMMLRTGMITLTLIGMLRTGRKREKRGEREREAGLLMMGLIGGEGSPLPTSSSSINIIIIIIMIISQRGERALFEEMIVA